jgi:hypothetical protein
VVPITNLVPRGALRAHMLSLKKETTIKPLHVFVRPQLKFEFLHICNINRYIHFILFYVGYPFFIPSKSRKKIKL